MNEEKLSSLQAALGAEGLDGWLFYDFRGSDPIGRSILGLGEGMATRRWYYCVPAAGEPRALVSAVEASVLSNLPGTTRVYRSWREHEEGLRDLLRGLGRVAMQYSPRNAIPYVSRVDAGTVESIRSLGVEVVSSADLVQHFEAVWSPAQYASHRRAAEGVREVVEEAFGEIGRRVRARRACSEWTMQRFILDGFERRGLVTLHPPIVAAGPHSADPHHQPVEPSTPIGGGDFVLIDLWAKEPDGVYADITWTGWVGPEVPERHAGVFGIVARARDAGVEAVRAALRDGRPLRGFEVDEAVRNVVRQAGHGEHFVHRTGHSIGVEVHGNGANIDGFETRDERRILPHTCFSIEPGIYLRGDFGVRSELNVYVDGADAVVTGLPVQSQVVPILGDGWRTFVRE
jgi:Xaa-Pro aminopeptidase